MIKLNDVSLGNKKPFFLIAGPCVIERKKLEYLPDVSSSHYEIAPYNFSPKLAQKLVSTQFHDAGQGIPECLSELHAVKLIQKMIRGIHYVYFPLV